MILRQYIGKEDRDPSKYLGIDRKPIPFEIFKGMFSTKGNVYTDGTFSEVTLIVSDDEKSLVLVSNNDDDYITLEDAQSTDIWHKVGFVLPEHSTFDFSTMVDSVKTFQNPINTLLERYYAGETGLLEYSNTEYNDKGEYMKVYHSFDTRPESDSSVVNELRRHAQFIHVFDNTVPIDMRNMKVRANSDKISELNKAAHDQFTSLKAFNPNLVANLPKDAKFSSFLLPAIGRITLEEDNTVEDLIVTKIDI